MRHEVAIYTASSATAGLYDRAHGRAGGAEIQMTLLARALAERGHRVAHVIYKPVDQVELPYPVTLIHRGRYAARTPVAGPFREAKTIWQALRAADSEVVIVRTASPALGIAALYCRFARRRLVFSSSNVSDFRLERMGRANRQLYRLGAQLADAVVVQSTDQVSLAHATFPSLRLVVRIPSFAEPPPAQVGESHDAMRTFLWIGRVVQEKQPLEYIRLARAVPEARFRMVAVSGERTDEALEELHAAARDVANLEFVEPLPREDLARLIASSVAVVSTSVLEGMPNVFLEAWSRGVPVLTLAFDPDGIVERHDLGISARGSWDRFVEGARELWASRDDQSQTSTRVRAYVERTHSAAAVASRWEELIAAVRSYRPVHSRR